MRQEIVTLVCDITGGPADETVRFGLDGTSFEIDLSDVKAKELRDTLAEFVAAARKVRAGHSPAARKPSTDREQNQAIREWARGQGIGIAERGRIPAGVLEAFAAGHA